MRTQQTNTQTLGVWTRWFEISLCDDPQIACMVTTAGAYAKAIRDSNPAHWMVVLGKTGNGKTHVCDRIWKWASKWAPINNINLRYHPQKIFWPDFVDQLRDGNAFDRYNDMKHWPFLYLDDVWAHRASDFSEEKLNTLLGCRAGKWTMITANSTMQAIAGRDVRIASRFLRDGCKLIDIRTTDYNRRNP